MEITFGRTSKARRPWLGPEGDASIVGRGADSGTLLVTVEQGKVTCRKGKGEGYWARHERIELRPSGVPRVPWKGVSNHKPHARAGLKGGGKGHLLSELSTEGCYKRRRSLASVNQVRV